jgi:hypothetical protein
MARIGTGAGGRTAFGPAIHDLESAASKASSNRTCDEPGCSTLLSRYNNDSSCWLHARPTFTTRSAGRHGA